MQYLVHYGTKGMRWGERRYQNTDGSLTPLGRERYGVKSSRFVKGYNSPYTTELKRPKLYSFYGIQTPSGAKYEREVQDRRKYFDKKRASELKRTASDVESILSSMSDKDLALLNIGRRGIKNYSSDGYDFVKRFVLKDSAGIPVSFLDFQESRGHTLNVVIGTRGEPEYRKKGYAAKVAKKGLEWADKNAKYLDVPYSSIQWLAYSGNTGSRKLAERNGFNLEFDEAEYYTGPNPKDATYWFETEYTRKIKSK